MEPLETELSGPVMTITLSDEARRNVLSNQLLGDFIDAIDRAEAHDEVRVVVVTNRGSVFCAGADLRERAAANEEQGRGFGLAGLFQRIRRSPKPFVGRIAGHCVAGGVGLAAVMDIDEAFEWTSTLSAKMFASPEAGEGMAAFLEKRSASWVARLGESR